MAKADGIIEVDTSQLDEAKVKMERLIVLTNEFLALCKQSWFLRLLFGVKK